MFSVFSWYIMNVVLVVTAEGIIIIIAGQSIQVKLQVRLTILHDYVYHAICQEMNHLDLSV